MHIDAIVYFVLLIDFDNRFKPSYKKFLLTFGTKTRYTKYKRNLSSIKTILIIFYQPRMACLKYFYFELTRNDRNLFSDLVHDDRFIVLIRLALSKY